MDAEIKAKLKSLLKVNEQLNAQVETLRNDLYDCVDAVELVFGKLLNSKGQLSIQKATRLIANPAGLESSIMKLMQAIDKHGKKGRSEQ